MAADIEKLMAEVGWRAKVEDLVQAAYKQGVADTLARIAAFAADEAPAAKPAAAPAPTPAPQSGGQLGPIAIEASGLVRARRGLVQETLSKIVAANPGKTVSDYEKLVTEAEPEISTKSVGNELRRREGIQYRRDRPGGYLWYPMTQKSEGDGEAVAGPPSPALFN